MDFWDAHGIFFIIGIIFWPRMLMLYFGMIAPMQIDAIVGWALVPRIYSMSLISHVYYDKNPTLITICWVLAIVAEIISIIGRFKFMRVSMQMASEEYENAMRSGMLRRSPW